MASRRAKRIKKKKRSGVDLEALGLVMLALAVFISGLLVPVLPTGELGDSLRTELTQRVGWGVYALPWPLLVLGGLFLLRKNPKAWPRVLAGYLVVTSGLWSLLALVEPDSSGAWGAELQSWLAANVGGLSFVLTLFVISLGLELILAWRPTRIVRVGFLLLLNGVRRLFRAGRSTRKSLKTRAAFQADVALARSDLKALGGDLKALDKLYPGSAELDKWRRAIKQSLGALRRADEERLEDVRANLLAWQNAVLGFTQDRAQELSTTLRSEGIQDFEGWLAGLKAQLGDPVQDPVRIARPLDDIRTSLALDLTALADRYRRLTRERDLDEAGLKDLRPNALARVSQRHGSRLQAYKKLEEGRAALGKDTDLLEPWRDLSARLVRLSSAQPDSEELKDYSVSLAAELRDKGRAALQQLDGWQEALDAVALRLSDAPAEPGTPDLADIEPPSSPGPEATQGVLIDLPAAPQTSPVSSAADEELPEVGGIPIQVPPYDLLDRVVASREDPALQAREVQERVAKIDATLANFKLQGRVSSSVRGPTVTRFEVEPAPGEKISRFANLSDDLALAMAVGSVRIEAPIPGKSVIGLEVPNANRDLITFREAAEAPAFRRSKQRLPLILGKSIDGEMVVADLAKMPHLLIAGSTGAGKSVAINTLLGSLIYKFLPTELRLLMIDPKMVELTPYDGIPHLLRPVVTNPNDAAGVLLGAVSHMERRYKMMSKIGAKNLDQYNEKARNLDLPEMPFIVIVIDELADLMITSPKEVESAIMRLAQMARATGMHLVLATQRPSVDILTSLIKVNVPARIAFAVSSGHDSRTILDTMGAERLTGMGDMLFYQPGLSKPIRLQGPFISETEIAQVAGFLRRQFFDDDFVEAYGADFDPPPEDDSSATGMIDWNDDKLRTAAEIVVNEGQASVSRLQRRLSVGHARAGKLMDSLEYLKVVGPHQGSKPRDVLVDMDELPNIFGR